MIRTFVFVWLPVLAATAAPAMAQTAYKCTDAQGGSVYQSVPCQDGRAPADKEWRAERPSDYRLESERRRAEHQVEQDRRDVRRRNANAPITAAVGNDDTPRCEAAKARRQRLLEQGSAGRGADTIRQLDWLVRELCD